MVFLISLGLTDVADKNSCRAIVEQVGDEVFFRGERSAALERAQGSIGKFDLGQMLFSVKISEGLLADGTQELEFVQILGKEFIVLSFSEPSDVFVALWAVLQIHYASLAKVDVTIFALLTATRLLNDLIAHAADIIFIVLVFKIFPF